MTAVAQGMQREREKERERERKREREIYHSEEEMEYGRDRGGTLIINSAYTRQLHVFDHRLP